MTISFTGINNLRVARKNSQKFGLVITASKNVEPKQADVTHAVIRCNLTNDNNGKHLEELKQELEKAGRNFVYKPDKPNEIELSVKRYDIVDDVIPISQTVLKLNDQPINITKREDLGLYTYLARITREMSSMAKNNPKHQETIDMVNDSIAQEATNYIDNVL